MLELLLASNSVIGVLVALEVHEPGDFVAGGETAWCLFAVLIDSFAKIVGDPDVENVRAVGEDVDPELIFASWHSGSPVRVVARLAKRRFPSGMTTKTTTSANADSLRE